MTNISRVFALKGHKCLNIGNTAILASSFNLGNATFCVALLGQLSPISYGEGFASLPYNWPLYTCIKCLKNDKPNT